ncbi:MAG TPA: c-type cytochrome [Methylomirabilota bacterium]|jgi:cytochrome c553|nr:c-type cytochrome [Methylomirabilota bacterium]
MVTRRGQFCAGGESLNVIQFVWVMLTVVLVFFGRYALASAEDLARGKQLYKLCSACHGENGQGNSLHNAPVIAGLAPWYIEAQLYKFRSGQRGYHADDVAGLQMRPMARALKSDEDLKSVAAYVAGLPPAQPGATLQGDAAHGKELYATCIACHGQDGKGNDAVKSPGLIHQADWYFVAQLKKFRDGLRGARNDDPTGAQMRAMTVMLQDEQSLTDLAAYVGTLGR